MTNIVFSRAKTPLREKLVKVFKQEIPTDFAKDKIDKLKEIDNDISQFLKCCDPTIKEQVVLKINHIIVKDTLAESGQMSWKNDDRSRYMKEILEILNDFETYSSSMNLRGSIYYYVACLCFKVHDYDSALQFFIKSKNIDRHDVNRNGLTKIERVKRDIFITFCYEYNGHPESSIEFLLGITNIGIFETTIYSHKEDIITAIVDSGNTKDKYSLIRVILGFDEFTTDNILNNLLLNIESEENSYREGMDEVIHVFAHCLSEYKMKAEIFTEEVYGDAKFKERKKLGYLIKLIAIKLIDTLDESYTTCKATIRAESGDPEGAIRILPDDKILDGREPEDRAEIDFYRFYFKELFSGLFSEKNDKSIETAGSAYRNYCESETSKLDVESKNDALLHYHIFEVKWKLRSIFEEILTNGKKRNSAFLAIEFNNTDWASSFNAVIQGKFSSFANKEIIKEFQKLHVCLNILLEITTNKLPIFFSNDEKIRHFNFENNGNQLFELCKTFNSLFYERDTFERLGSSDKKSKYRTYYIHNLKFDICADDYTNFESCMNILFDDEKVKYSNKEFDKQTSTTKIISGDQQVLDILHQKYHYNPKLNMRVFYSGKTSVDYEAAPIAVFSNLKTCILMAYIYATIESMLDYICKPRPIYILAPLRDTGSYYFQNINWKHFVPFDRESSDKQCLSSTGIGITPQFASMKTKESIPVNYYSDEVREYCYCGLIYRDKKLFVLNKEKDGDRFIEKSSVDCQLIDQCYQDYFKKRETCRNYNTIHDESDLNNCPHTNLNYCKYVFRSINELANQNATNNPIAKNLLLELLILACREGVTDYNYKYVMENNTLEGLNMNNIQFTIYLFDRKIEKFNCYNELIVLDGKESTYSEPSNELMGAPSIEVLSDILVDDGYPFEKVNPIWICLIDLKKDLENSKRAADNCARQDGIRQVFKEMVIKNSDEIQGFINLLNDELAHKELSSPRIAKSFFETIETILETRPWGDYLTSEIKVAMGKILGCRD